MQVCGRRVENGRLGYGFMVSSDNRHGVWWQWQDSLPTVPLTGVPFPKLAVAQLQTLSRKLVVTRWGMWLLLTLAAHGLQTAVRQRQAIALCLGLLLLAGAVAAPAWLAGAFPGRAVYVWRDGALVAGGGRGKRPFFVGHSFPSRQKTAFAVGGAVW